MFAVVEQKTWHPAKLGEIAYHPACTKPDQQTLEDYARLKADINENGIREPIKVQKSSKSVIAGRHRIKAAMELGIPIPVDILDITDSECWSLSKSQLCHRNLSSTRAATLYVEMRDAEEKARAEEIKASRKEEDEDVPPADDEKGADKKTKKKEKKEKKRAEKGTGKKTAKEAKEAGVSTATMERVKLVKAKGVPALWKAMDSGDVSALDASAIVEYDHDTQKKCLALVKGGEAKTLVAAKKLLDKQEKEAAGPVLKDGKGKEVPKSLRTVFEDREQFTILRENIKDLRKEVAKLVKRESGKHLPKDMVQQLDDMILALDLYQPYKVQDESEDGWITKRSASEQKQ